MKYLLRVLPFLFLSGCMVGPNYTPPDINVPDAWTSNESGEEGEVVSAWWEAFNDPLLSKYIEKAEKCNFNILVAEAHVLRARALRQVSASSLFPQISADVNGVKTYFSKNGPAFAIGPAAGDPTVTSSQATGLPFDIQIPQIQNLFNALFDASWELDLFGKTRRSIEQADALIGSSIEEKNDVLISVFAEVARNYLELRSFQTKKDLIEQNIRAFEETNAITHKRFEAGYASEYDVELSEANVAKAKASMPDLIAEIYRSIYTLSILTGELPENLIDELLVIKPMPKAPENIAVGLRSDLLRRRPDVRKAERELAAATASIGVAVASFFPTVNLLGMGGFQSLQLPELLTWGSKTWAYGTDITMPVYQGGRLVGNLHFTQAMQAAAAYSYQEVVLNAIQNAESSLVFYQEQQAKVAQFDEVVARIGSAFEISSGRFSFGLVSRLELLDAQRLLIEAQTALVESDRDLLLSVVSLYKALGGGWQESASN